MKNHQELKKRVRVLSLLGLCVLLNFYGLYADQKQTKLLQGDLAIVGGCRTELVGVDHARDSHLIHIIVTVANLMPGTTTDEFKVRFERGDQTGARWPQSLVTIREKLTYGLADRMAPSKKMNIDAYVPIGQNWDYYVTILPQKPTDDASPGNNTCKTHYSTVAFGDGGGDEAVIRGVDLVVSSVEVRRGVFSGGRKVQIIPTIRNMWHGRTAQRIRISIHEYSLAWWIEGGIGGDEEKMGGAVYIDDPSGNLPLTFTVVVDSANEITENNEGNNSCGPITLIATQDSVIHRCPIVGPHDDLH